MRSIKIIALIISVFMYLGCSDNDSVVSNDTDEVSLEEVETNPDYILIDTGQENCYDSDGDVIAAPLAGELFFGQDAQYNGTQFSFAASEDYHGAGGVRFDTKVEGGPLDEGGEKYYNYVRLV